MKATAPKSKAKSGPSGPRRPSQNQFKEELLAHLPDGVTAQEGKLQSLLSEYASQYSVLEAEWSQASRKPPLEELLLPPPPDLAEAEDFFARRCKAVVEEAVQLDYGLPSLQLRSEQLRQQVLDAGNKCLGGTTDSIAAFVLERLLRRQGAMRYQRAALQAALLDPNRLLASAVAAAGAAPAQPVPPAAGGGGRRISVSMAGKRRPSVSGGGSVQVEQKISPEQAALQSLDFELEFGTRRLRQLYSHVAHQSEVAAAGSQGGAQSLPSTAQQLRDLAGSPLWRGSAAVLLRQIMLEDSVTKEMRYFLLQLQYLGLSQRCRIWRKSLEHRAVQEAACDGTSGSRLRVVPLPVGVKVPPKMTVPLGATNRKRLERCVVDLAVAFKLGTTSLQPDRGKTFAHQAGISFPDIFQTQQKRWQFKVYPIGCGFGAGESSNDAGGAMGAAAGEEERLYLRPSEWAVHLPWKPSLDPEIMEQDTLLRASFARRSSPKRVQHRNQPTYARQLLQEAEAAAKSDEPVLRGLVEVAGGGLEAIDSLLGTEMKSLQLGDVGTAVRRCTESAEKPVGGPGAADMVAEAAAAAAAAALAGSEPAPVVEEKNSVPAHLLRAYYLLRYLQCRSQRWQLLGALNFFRYTQRRLLAGQAVVLPRDVDEGRGGDTSTRVEEKAQDKYWDISCRGLSRILKHGSLPFASDGSGHSKAELTGAAITAGRRMEREEHKRSADDSMNITDSFGRKVMHEAALADLEALELDMLRIGSYFIHKYEATGSEEREVAAVDRAAVLYDLYAAEVWFNMEKRDLVETYLKIYEETTDLMERQTLSQRITDVMATRPRLDLLENYFVEAYASSIMMLQSRHTLLTNLFNHQVAAERHATRKAAARTQQFYRRDQDPQGVPPKDSQQRWRPPSTKGSALLSPPQSRGQARNAADDIATDGLAHRHEGASISGGYVEGPASSRNRSDSPEGRRGRREDLTPVEKMMLCGSAAMAWKAELLIEEVYRDLVQHYNPPSPVAATCLERACYVTALERWHAVIEEEIRPGARVDEMAVDNPELHLQLVHVLARKLAQDGESSAAESGQDARNEAAATLTGSIATSVAQESGALPSRPVSPASASSPEPGASPSPTQSPSKDATWKPVLSKQTVDALGQAFGGACGAAAARHGIETWADSLEVDELLQAAFADVMTSVNEAKSAGYVVGPEMTYNYISGILLARTLEHLHLRYRLEDAAYQVRHINWILTHQAPEFGTQIKPLKPCLSAGEDASTTTIGWTSSLIEVSMGHLQGDTTKEFAMNCCSRELQELRRKLQHELAFCGLALACAQKNAILLDPQLRQREAMDIGAVGLSRDALASDGGMPVMRRLRESLEISGLDRDHLHERKAFGANSGMDITAGGTVGDTNVSEEVIQVALPQSVVMDMSRYAQYLNEPSRFLEPVFKNLRRVYEDLRDGLKPHQQRMLCYELLKVSSLFSMRSACDLYVGLQAAHTSLELMSLASLLPKTLSPFTYGDKQKPIVERDGLVGSVFSIPTAFDVLQHNQLKAFPPIADSALPALVESLLQEFRESQPEGGIMSHEVIFEAERPDLAVEERVLRQLDITYSGPLCTVLRVLHGMGQLLLLRYATCTLDADPVGLLEAQRQCRSALADPEPLFKSNNQSGGDKDGEGADGDAEQEGTKVNETTAMNSSIEGAKIDGVSSEAESKELSKTSSQADGRAPLESCEPIFEAFEELCSDFARLACRLDNLGQEACRKPAKVLAVLGSELRAAHRQLAVLLRWATRGLVQEESGEESEACVLRNWSRYLEEGVCPVGGVRRPWMRDLLPPKTCRSPLHQLASVSQPTYKIAVDSWDDLDSETCVALPLWPQPPERVRGDLPEISRLQEDGRCFLALFHPETRQRIHPMVEAMLGPYALESQPSESGGAATEAPQISLKLPWMLPEMPLSALLLLPLGISDARRRQLSVARASLAERRRAMLLLRNLHMDSDMAVDMEADLFGLWLLRERLQEVVVTGHLALPGMPTEDAALARVHAQLAATIPPEEPAVPERSTGPTMDELPAEAVGRELEAVRKQLAALVPALSQLLLAKAYEKLGTEFAAMMGLRLRLQAAKSSSTGQGEAPAKAESFSSTRSRSFKQKSPVDKQIEALLTRGPYAATLDGLLRPIVELKRKSTYVRMGNEEDGERAHVFKEIQINACLEDLTAGLSSWGLNVAITRERRTDEILRFLAHQQEALKFRIAKNQAQTIKEGHLVEDDASAPWLPEVSTEAARRRQKEVMEAKFRTEVASRSCGLVYEVDRLHRALRDLKAASRELENRLEGEVMDEVRGTISSFTGALAAEAGRFSESHQDDAQRLAMQIRSLREHATTELAALAAKNKIVQIRATQPRQRMGLETLVEGDGTAAEPDTHEIVDGGDSSTVSRHHRRPSVSAATAAYDKAAGKQAVTVSDGMYKKLGEVASRDDVFLLQLRLKELKDRQVLSRMFHHFKCQCMKQRFEQQVQALHATLESNSELLEQFAEVSKDEMAAAAQFQKGAQDVANIEKRSDELRSAVDANEEQRRRLAKWKKHKQKQLLHMQASVREHQLAGTVDVASLLQEIQDKQALVELLTKQKEETHRAVTETKAKSDAHTAQVKSALQEQRRVKDSTFFELQQLRAEMQKQNPVGNQRERIDMWRNRLLEARHRLEELEEENTRLRILSTMNRRSPEVDYRA
eukprot:TRINITY_DN19671_c0_g3_i1.p1 TRINITY_DN19671_c0_g3~~TRINITY_DN19671_c0_g3_i1.p1  ORF type:complete len:2698 (-),score=629.15 TRINITY_DN19671_c0_g3_i1:85-8178(-)